MVTTDVEPLQEVLDSDAAEILSCALSHKRITKSPFKLTDPYFTKEQWEIVLDGQGELLNKAEELLDTLDPVEQQKAKDWVENKRQIPTL